MSNFMAKEIILIIMLSIVFVVNTHDLIGDILEKDDLFHIITEFLVVCLSLIGIFLMVKYIKQGRKKLNHLHQEIDTANSDLCLIKIKLQEIGQEYSRYIKKQFQVWKLTKSEQEVALFLLKGLSFKEISELRNTKEKTVRQQASAIYKKSNTVGRHEFSAWFFEDILK